MKNYPEILTRFSSITGGVIGSSYRVVSLFFPVSIMTYHFDQLYFSDLARGLIKVMPLILRRAQRKIFTVLTIVKSALS